ncbi:MAG: substrate-binding domain-containing protein [Terracidiphilus sp.]
MLLQLATGRLPLPRLGRLCSLLGILLVLPGCRREPPIIAVIPRTCGTWLWEAEHTGVVREAPGHGLYVYWNAPMREDDVQDQIEILSGAVKRKVVGVIIAPIEDLPLRTPLQRTIRAGIPVVVVGTDLGLTPGKDLAYVNNDETAGGALAARRIGRILHGHGTVAILGINKKLASTTERARSLEAALADEFPDIHVAFRSLALPTVSQEQQVAERMLAVETRPDAIVALSEPSTRGAFFALIESGRTRNIPLIGFDQNILAPVRTGDIDSVIILNTYQMGRMAMKLVAAELAGNTVQSHVIVQPQLVTRETIDSPAVRETLDLDWYRQ